jgi:hypothetical protein
MGGVIGGRDMSDFTKVFALISGISLCVLAGLFAVGFAYGADAVGFCIGVMILVAMVVSGAFWVAMEITGGPDGHVPYVGVREWPSADDVSPRAVRTKTPPPPKR